MNIGTINFDNNIQRNLWKYMLVGQISDGYWENARPYDHYHFWCDLTPIYDDKAPAGVTVTSSRYTRPLKNNYAFDSKILIDVVGDEMLAIAKASTLFKNINQDLIESAIDGWRRMSDIKKSVISSDTIDKVRAVKFTIADLKRELKRIKEIVKLPIKYTEF